MNEEKREIIHEINEIRKEIGLEPYPLVYLETKDIEELKKLYSTYFRLREDYIKRLKEEKKFKVIFKTMLLIIVSTVSIISFLSFFLFLKPRAVNPLQPPPLGPIEKSGNESVIQTSTNFVIESSFKGPENRYFLIIKNVGATNITFSKIMIDNEDVNFEVFSGNYPLSPQSIVYIKIFKECDNLIHQIKIIDDQNKSLESTLQPC